MAMDANTSAILRALRDKQAVQQETLDKLQELLQGMVNTPKYVENIPGKRSPHFEVVEITLSASSTAKKEGTATVGVDGPFVITAIALFYQKTSGAYANVWGPASAFDARLPATGMQFGFQKIFDQPHCMSFTVEITAQGNQILWQSKPIASALWSPQAGGCYVLPAVYLVERGGSLRVALTPDVSVDYTGLVQAIFCGYKILQAYRYQP